MKHTLLLTALLASGICPQDIFADEWVKPVPESTQFQYGDTLYMWNIGAKGFLSDDGGAYGTQAMIADKGMKMYIEKYIDPSLTPPDSVWDGKTLVINDYSNQHNKWCQLFINDMSVCYVDRNGQPNWFFELEDKGDGIYRIYGADINPTMNHATWPDTYMGADLTNPDDRALKPMLDIVNGANIENYCVDWFFVSQEEYEKIEVKFTTYHLAMDLKAKIDDALEQGVEVPEAQAIFENTSSTDEELKNAMQLVDVAIRKSIEDSASPDEPLDMALKGFLVNPTFDNDNSGWTTTTGAQNTGLASNKSDGVNLIGNAWENWNPSPITGKMYQNILKAPHGVYKFSLGVFSDSGAGTYVYCSSDSAEVIGTAPKTLEVFTTFEGDTLELGVKKYIKQGQWIQIDNASLIYYGNSVESYKFWINALIKQAPDFAEMHKSKAQYDTYCKLIEEIQALETKDEVIAHSDVFKKTLVDMQANVDAYSAYAQQIENAKKAVDEINNEELNDYIMDVAEPNLEAGEMSTEEMLAEVENLKTKIHEAYLNAVEEGKECTFIITNNDFKHQLDGWDVDPNLGTPSIGGPDDNPSVEKWSDNFDLSQSISGVPNGIYRLEVPAFYRTEGQDAAYANRETAEVLAYIYINEEFSPIANLMNSAVSDPDFYSNKWTSPDGTYVPNDMNNASLAFSKGLYLNTIYGVVADGNIKLGIRSTNATAGNRWSIWGAFKLYYEGYKADAIKDILQPLIDEGRDTVENCIFSKVDKEKLQNRVVEASNAIATDADGETLFGLYIGFRELIDSAKASVASYMTMFSYADQLANVLDECQETASDEAINNAAEVYDKVVTGYENGSFTTSDADSMVTVIKMAITKLRIPDIEASDDAPVDYTAVIVNPNYDNEDNEGWSGSSPLHQTYHNAEFYNTNFDMYQIIYGLPNGTYELKLTGFYRSMSLAVDTYEKYLEGKDTINAFLYAESGGVISSNPLMSILDDYSTDGLNSGVDEVKLKDGMYVPNQMITCGMYFDSGYYSDNSVICKVSDGTLKIGLKKIVTNNGDWAIFDSWKLFYYGDESSHEADGDASGIDGIDESDVVSRVYYTLGGVQSPVPVKGINIVKSVMSDGSVRINKIFVK